MKKKQSYRKKEKRTAVDQHLTNGGEQDLSFLFHEFAMVERENSQAAATFPQPVNSNANVQNTACKPLFVTEADTKTEPWDPVGVKEELVCNPDLNKDVEKNATFLQENVFAVNESNYDGPFYHNITMSNLEGSWQPLSEVLSSASDPYFEANSPLSFWGSCPLDLETMKMDDVFQVDKDDLIQSPTLAELNANDESLFDSFDNFDVFFPSDSKAASVSSSACDTNSVFKLSSLSNTDPVKIGSETLSAEKSQESQLPDSFIKSCTSIQEPDIKSESSLADGKLQTVPTLSVDSIKGRLRQNACLSSKEAKRTVYQDKDRSRLYSADAKIETTSHFPISSNPDHFDSDEEDSEMDCNYSSDADEESEEETKHHPVKNAAVKNLLVKKKSRYFWQYNMQAKGPKAPKIKLTEKASSLHDFADPIFSSDCPVDGIKHAGKARRGDGNDLTPNPKKLYNIGLELEKLNSLIDGLIPVNELPLNARSDSRKEKNKLASRACRLKKKAQHEANKLKLFGLQQEQKYLLKVINEVKKILRERIENFKPGTGQSVVSAIHALSMKKAVIKVAGCSADFVNNVLKNVASGDESGGLRGLYAALVHKN